ncbi:MAG: hypothetical protein WAS27_03575 [Candidatus Saccharimonadales bacterium]
MSTHDTGGKPSRLDRPEQQHLVGQLTEMYEVLDDGYNDDGWLTEQALMRACEVGRAVLDRYEDKRVRWQVYSELTADTYSDLHDMTLGECADVRTTNVIGDISDIDIDADDNDIPILTMTIESSVMGQYDRYTIPIAKAGDVRVFNEDDTLRRLARPIDTPVLIRDRYEKRLTKQELADISDFYEAITHTGNDERALLFFLERKTSGLSRKYIDEFFVALNLDIDDAKYAGCPYWLDVTDARSEVLYDHGDPSRGVYAEYIDGGAWYDVVRINYDLTKSGSLGAVSLIACPQDNDKLVNIPIEGTTSLTIHRPDLG